MKNAIRKLGLHRRLLRKGESLVAGGAMALGVVLLAAIAGMSWWAGRSNFAQQRQANITRAGEVASIIARSAESLLPQSELSALRGLVIQAAAEIPVKSISIEGSGGILAHSEPSQINLSELAPQNSEPPHAGPGQALAQLPNGAWALVKVVPKPLPPPSGMLDTRSGVAAIGAAALALLLVLYRFACKKFGALGAIRDALLDAAAGEERPEALAVSDNLGSVAKAWNALLADRERLRAKITQEKAAEALGNPRQRRGGLQDACDAMWQGFIVVDEQLRVKYANGAAAVFLQTSRETLQNADLCAVVNDERATEILKGMADGSIKQRRTIEVERAGEFAGVLRVSIRPVRRDDAGVALVMIEDVTQQRIAEQARSAFVAQATHELRTPLTNIRLYVEQAQELAENDHAQRAKCLNVINQESRRLERVVADMLSVSEIEAGSLKLQVGDVRLEALFPELQDDYTAQALSKDMNLRFDLPPKLPVIRADRDKISVVLHNLLGNAIKYTPAGGEVSVHVEADDRELRVDVKDNGIGIAEAERERIFEKFYRAQDKRVDTITGTGLGLAIAREIARLHGGDLSVESVLNQGSTFTLRLPVAPDKPAGVRLAA